jgi:hypothetical protein
MISSFFVNLKRTYFPSFHHRQPTVGLAASMINAGSRRQKPRTLLALQVLKMPIYQASQKPVFDVPAAGITAIK